jgi:putative transposase
MLIATRSHSSRTTSRRRYLARACGTALFAYNRALAEWDRQYRASKLDPALPAPSEMALRRQLNTARREQFPWMLEVTKCAPLLAIRQLDTAFKNFFAGRARYPTFRRKGVHDRFSLSNDQFAVDGPRLRIPNLGWVRMREVLRIQGKLMSATVSRVANRWFVSLTVEVHGPIPSPAKNQGSVGVDLGVTTLTTLLKGERVPGPKPHKALLGRLSRLSRGLSRRVKVRPTERRPGPSWPDCTRASATSGAMPCTSSRAI